MTAPRIGRLVDVEKLAVAWLTARGRDAGTHRPSPLRDGFVWVTGVGGPSDYDTALLRVDLHTFHAGSDGAAMPTAELVHGDMAALGGQTVDGQPVHTVFCSAYPTRRFWADGMDRVVATYELDLPVL